MESEYDNVQKGIICGVAQSLFDYGLTAAFQINRKGVTSSGTKVRTQAVSIFHLGNDHARWRNITDIKFSISGFLFLFKQNKYILKGKVSLQIDSVFITFCANDDCVQTNISSLLQKN